MIIGSWMSRDVVTIGPDALVSEAAEIMARRRIRRLLVVAQRESDPHLLGIISATDVLHVYPPEVNPFAVVVRQNPAQNLAVGDIMNTSLFTVSPEMPIEEAARQMRQRKIGALPVLRDGKLKGIITESDIFRAFISILAPEGSGARITIAIDRGEDAFALVAAMAAKHAVQVVSFITCVEGDRPVCVVRLTGPGIEPMLDALWRSEHRVLSVIRYE